MRLWEAAILVLAGTHVVVAKISKDVVANVACEVCGQAVREALDIAQKEDANSEDDLSGIVENICSVTRGKRPWLAKLDITRPVANGPLRLQKHESLGRCRKECSIMQRACAVSLDGKEDALVQLLQNDEVSALQLEEEVCQRVCKAKLPTLSNWQDELFDEKRGLDADELAEYKHKLGIEGEVNSWGSPNQLDVQSLPAEAKQKLQAAVSGKQGGSGGPEEVNVEDLPEDVQQKLRDAKSGNSNGFGSSMGGLFGGAMGKNQLDVNSLPSHVKSSLGDALNGVNVTVKLALDNDLLDEAAKPPSPGWDGTLNIHFRTLMPLEKLFHGFCSHVGLRREGVSFSFRTKGTLSGRQTLSHYGIGDKDVLHVSSDVAEDEEEL